MQLYLEVWGDKGPEAVPLEGDQFTIGTDASADLALDDPAVSALHAALQYFPAGWSVRDLGSRNGTFVNGERISSEQMLRDGDEIRVGHVRVVLKDPAQAPRRTEALGEPPRLTPRERDVLLELCRPLLQGDAFTEPASVGEIARALVVTDAAVKQHVTNLYDKFGLMDEDRKRVRLANVALQTGAVSLGDLRPA
jgi:pSer/pThr/pTyr-binding forkhead associated (FHA) protein